MKTIRLVLGIGGRVEALTEPNFSFLDFLGINLVGLKKSGLQGEPGHVFTNKF